MDTDALNALALLGAAGNRTLGWLITYLVHSSAIIAVVWAIARSPVGRAGSLRGRDLLFKSALLGGVVTSAIQSGFALDPVAGTVRLFERVRQSMFVVVRREDRVTQSAGRTDSLTIRVARAERGAAPVEWQSWTVPAPPAEARLPHLEWIRAKGFPAFSLPLALPIPAPAPMTTGALALIVVWFLGASAGAVWHLIARARLTRRIDPRRDASGSKAQQLLERLMNRAGVRRRVRLTTSEVLASPVALDGREICIPARALVELSPTELEAILAHELAHVVRRDTTWLRIASLTQSLFFFQPLNRWAVRQMRDASELAADEWAVQQTRQPLVLARCLATVARWLTASPVGPAAPAMVEAAGSPLVRRVRRLTSDAPPRPAAVRLLIPVAAAMMTIAVTAFAPRVTVGSTLPSPTFSRETRIVMKRLGDSTAIPRVLAAHANDEVVMVRGTLRPAPTTIPRSH